MEIMKSDFELIIHNIPQVPEVKLFFVGDLHVGSIESNRKAWEDFCANVLADKSAYLLILGDMVDNGTKLSIANVFDSQMRPSEQKKYLAKSLEPLRNRILCGCQGNHEARNKDCDDDPLYDVFAKLDLEDLYRPNCAFVKICIGERNAGNGHTKPNQCYVAAVLHGAGGGILSGATINRNERFAMQVLEGVDILAVGHTHKGIISKPSKIIVDSYRNTIRQSSMTVISCCSWLSYGGYALRKMLLPHQAQDPEHPQTVILSGNRNNRYVKTIW